MLGQNDTARFVRSERRRATRTVWGFMTRVLIVDDDPVQLRLTAEVARRAGFVPVTAQGGLPALDILRSDQGIGVVVLDLVMPDLDGMAVIETLRRENITTPIIVQTANSSLETVVTAMRHGAADFFVKPVAQRQSSQATLYPRAPPRCPPQFAPPPFE